MRVFEIPLILTSLFGSCLFAVLDVSPAYGDFTFGEPVSVRSTIPVLIPEDDEIYCFSYDYLEMYFGSPRPGGQGELDLWVSKRASKEEDWGPPENLGPAVNSPEWDYYASISADGLSLYFASSRPGDPPAYDDLYVTTRATRSDPWGPAVNLGPPVNVSGAQERFPWISPDDLELYFMCGRSGGYGSSDIWVARRTTKHDPWEQPVNLGPVVNSPYGESHLSLSSDGLLLLFSGGFNQTSPRPGGYGGSDMWMSGRAGLSAPWQAPVNLGPKVNSPAGEWIPRLSPDGRTLYFLSARTGGDYCWQASIEPILDFNGDKKVDLVDLVMLIDDWGTNKALCDVGPMPWGDGKVDIEDLKVFMAYWEKENSVHAQNDQ
jgi:Tol biopolymer transport system component